MQNVTVDNFEIGFDDRDLPVTLEFTVRLQRESSTEAWEVRDIDFVYLWVQFHENQDRSLSLFTAHFIDTDHLMGWLSRTIQKRPALDEKLQAAAQRKWDERREE